MPLKGACKEFQSLYWVNFCSWQCFQNRYSCSSRARPSEARLLVVLCLKFFLKNFFCCCPLAVLPSWQFPRENSGHNFSCLFQHNRPWHTWMHKRERSWKGLFANILHVFWLQFRQFILLLCLFWHGVPIVYYKVVETFYLDIRFLISPVRLLDEENEARSLNSW